MKTGLVLEGGGMRGLYTAGVLDAFMDNDIYFDGVIGVSAGAIHGCSFVSRQRGRSIRYYKKYSSDPRFMGFSNILKNGDIVDVDFCYHELPEKLDVYDNEAFKKSKTDFYVSVTDLETGKAYHKHMQDMFTEIDYLRASASLPYFSRPVHLDGKKYLDGAIGDSVPVEAFQKMGYEKCVVVLTRQDGYVKKPEYSWLAKLWFPKHKAFAKALQNRHESYNNTIKRIKEMETAGEVIVIRPAESLNIGRLENDPVKLESIYKIGYEDGLNALTKVRTFIEKKSMR